MFLGVVVLRIWEAMPHPYAADRMPSYRTYEVLPLDPGAGTKTSDDEGLSDHATEE